MNKRELKSFMARHNDTGKELAECLGITRNTFSKKLNSTDGAEFTQGEIMSIVNRYSLTPEDVTKIFFNQEVS